MDWLTQIHMHNYEITYDIWSDNNMCLRKAIWEVPPEGNLYSSLAESTAALNSFLDWTLAEF